MAGCGSDKGVALVSQSSNIVINLAMQQRGLPVAYVACLGNAAVVGLAELAGALLDDPRVTAVGLYIEGIDDAPAFAALAEEARAMGKGVVGDQSPARPSLAALRRPRIPRRLPGAGRPPAPSCGRSGWPRSTRRPN